MIDCEREVSHLLTFPSRLPVRDTQSYVRVQLSSNFQRLRKSRGAEKRDFSFSLSLTLSVCSIPREKEIFRRNTTENKEGDIKEKEGEFH